MTPVIIDNWCITLSVFMCAFVHSRFRDHWPQSTRQCQTPGLHGEGASLQSSYTSLLPTGGHIKYVSANSMGVEVKEIYFVLSHLHSVLQVVCRAAVSISSLHHCYLQV